MYYIDYTIDSAPDLTVLGFSVKTQSIDLAVRIVQVYLRGYADAFPAQRISPEILAVGRSKTRGITYQEL